MIIHETATVTNAQHGLTETRNVLDSSQTVQRWEFLTRVWLRRSWSMTFLPPLYFVFHKWASGVSSMMVSLLKISFWLTHLTIVRKALLLYGKHLARLHMGSFDSDFFTDSVNTLQSWSTIEPNTCPRLGNASSKWEGADYNMIDTENTIRWYLRRSLDGICGDYCRLDVLLENYLEEIRVMNIFNRSLLTNSSHSSSNSNRSKSNCSICIFEFLNFWKYVTVTCILNIFI